MKNMDTFVLLNVALFGFMCYLVYYDRFVIYRGAENIMEFFLYAVLIFLAILIAWHYLRAYSFSSCLLIIAEIGILMHFSGGLVQLNGSRLYDNYFFGVRYDKYVHLANSFTACFLVKQLIDRLDLKPHYLESVFIVSVVLGLGAIIEIIEYIVTRTIPNHGVGGYDNNMQDLIANLGGGLLFVFISFRRGVVDKRKGTLTEK